MGLVVIHTYKGRLIFISKRQLK